MCAAAGHDCRRPVVVGDKWGCCFAERCDGEISPVDLFIYFCLCVYGGKLGFEQFGFLLARLVPFLFHDALLGRSAGYKYRTCKHCDGEEEYRLDAARCSPPPQGGCKTKPVKGDWYYAVEQEQNVHAANICF